jgi:hypothetical protein
MPEEKEISEEELEEIEEDDSEKEGLEEELEDVEIPEMQNLEFSSFIQPIVEESAPVLERLTGSQGVGFSLSGWESISGPLTGETEEKADSDYIVTNAPDYGSTELKYESTEPPVLKPTEFSREIPRQELLDPMEGRRIETFDTETQRLSPETVQRERRLPFQAEEKKYKEIKPKRVE